jgi:hypothetical protein
MIKDSARKRANSTRERAEALIMRAAGLARMEAGGAGGVGKNERIQHFHQLFDRLTAVAVWGDEARSVIDQVLKDTR